MIGRTILALRDWARRWPRPLWSLWGIGLVVLGWGSLSPSMAPPTGIGGIELNLDKFIHLGAYAPFSAFAWIMGQPPKRAWLFSLFMFALGMAYEGGQAYVPGRSASWDDLAANALGVALGVLIGRKIAAMRPR